MKLRIYRRLDCRLIAVAAASPQAKAAVVHGALHRVGTAYMPASSLSGELSRSIALHGHGVAGEEDHFLIYGSILRGPR